MPSDRVVKALKLGDKLLLTLQYWREYRSIDHLAYEYEVHKNLVYRAILWVEQTRPKKQQPCYFGIAYSGRKNGTSY